jgi:hypothetical protein
VRLRLDEAGRRFRVAPDRFVERAVDRDRRRRLDRRNRAPSVVGDLERGAAAQKSNAGSAQDAEYQQRQPPLRMRRP